MHNLDFSIEHQTAFFTGHRDFYSAKPIEKLIDLAIAQGVTHFLNGMAIGTDQTAASILVDRNLTWTAVIPFYGQSERWSESMKMKYAYLRKRATEEKILADSYFPGCLNQRNTWMASRSQICLAVWDGRTTGGTFHALTEARKRGIMIAGFNPHTGKYWVEDAEPVLKFGGDRTEPKRQTKNLFQFSIDNKIQ